MNRFFRDVRLIPIVLIATVCLFALKVSGIVFDGGYTMAERMDNNRVKPAMSVTSADSVPDYPTIVRADGSAPSSPAPAASSGKSVWAQEMFNYGGAARNDVTGSVAGGRAAPSPAGLGADLPAIKSIAPTSQTAEERAKAKAADVTGSAHGGGGDKPPADGSPPLKTSEKRPEPTKLDVGGQPEALPSNGKINSPGERAILGRLQDRSKEIDERARALDMRESLIKAAEKRLEAKVNELKETEQRIKAATEARDQAEADRFKGIIAMYENMKPKDAARIFNNLNMKVLAEVATALKPRTMSEILGQMSSDAAQKLTVELANRANAQAGPRNSSDLPKIDGKPNNS